MQHPPTRCDMSTWKCLSVTGNACVCPIDCRRMRCVTVLLCCLQCRSSDEEDRNSLTWWLQLLQLVLQVTFLKPRHIIQYYQLDEAQLARKFHEWPSYAMLWGARLDLFSSTSWRQGRNQPHQSSKLLSSLGYHREGVPNESSDIKTGRILTALYLDFRPLPLTRSLSLSLLSRLPPQ